MTAPTGGVTRRLTVSLFGSVTETRSTMVSTYWEKLVPRFLQHAELADKKAAPLWSPASYAVGATRNNANAQTLDLGVLDLDTHVDLDAIRASLAGYAYLMHSTWSHQPTAPRVRVILPLLEPVPAERWADAWPRLWTWTGQMADPAPKAPSSAYFVPSCPPGASKLAEAAEGRWLDVWALPEPTTLPTPAVTRIPHDLPSVDLDALGLSEPLARVIRLGRDADPERYGDRSEPEFFAICALVERGLDDASIASIVLDPHHAVGDKARQKRGAWLAGEIGRARARVGPPPTGGVETQTARPAPQDESDTSVRLGAIPKFPLTALPKPLRKLARSAEADAGVPATFVAGAGLAALAIAAGGETDIEAQVGWRERLILWVALIGKRDSGKTPAMDYAWDVLREADAALEAVYSDVLAAYLDDPAHKQHPVDPRRLVDDINLEALARRLNDQPALGWDADELSMVLRGLGEYKRGPSGDRGRFLKLWNGNSWNYTRVGSGGRGANSVVLSIPKPTVSICGGLQPALCGLLGDEVDGMRPRWGIFLAEAVDFAAHPPSGEAVDSKAWDDLISRLLQAREVQRTWRLSEHGRARFREYQRLWKQQARGDEPATVSALLGKADYALLKYTLALAEAEAPAAGGIVPDSVLDRAAQIVDFSVECERALPEPATLAFSRRDEALNAAAERWREWLEEHGPAPQWRLLENRVGGVATPEQRDQVLSHYVARYPGTREEQPPSKEGGRPRTVVHPPKRRPPRKPQEPESDPPDMGSSAGESREPSTEVIRTVSGGRDDPRALKTSNSESEKLPLSAHGSEAGAHSGGYSDSLGGSFSSQNGADSVRITGSPTDEASGAKSGVVIRTNDPLRPSVSPNNYPDWEDAVAVGREPLETVRKNTADKSTRSFQGFTFDASLTAGPPAWRRRQIRSMQARLAAGLPLHPPRKRPQGGS